MRFELMRAFQLLTVFETGPLNRLGNPPYNYYIIWNIYKEKQSLKKIKRYFQKHEKVYKKQVILCVKI